MSNATITHSDNAILAQIAKEVNTSKESGSTKWYYANNPDGSIRWLWPSTNKSAIVLSLYAQLSAKSKRMASFAKLAFKLNQPQVVAHGSISLDLLNSELNTWQNTLGTSELAIFTGTVGVNRKAVLALGTANKTEWFVKLPLGCGSESLIKNEISNLEILQGYNFIKSTTPSITRLNNDRVAQKALAYSNQPLQLTNLHWSAFEEWKQKSSKVEDLGESLFWLNLEAQFRKLILIKAHLKFPKHYELLRNIAGAIDRNMVVATGLSHQDFTPWNSGCDNDNLKVWDWELANFHTPLGLDALHFIMQGEAMLKESSFASIDKSWDSNYVALSTLLNDCPDHLTNLKALYLLNQVSIYLEIYHKQEVLHSQALHILQVWEQALTQEAEKLRAVKQRINFINIFFEWLPNNASYAWLKPTALHPSEISEFADIDIAIHENNVQNIIQFINQNSMVNSIKKISFSDRNAVQIQFKDGSRLNLDLLIAFRYKGSKYISIENIISQSILNEKRISIASPVYDWAYKSAFYTLNGANIPSRHIATWEQSTTDEQALLLAEASKLVNYKFQHISQLSDLSILKGVWRDEIKKDKSPFSFIKSKATYLLDVLHQIIKPRGAIITLSGVDGAGKSTILALIEKQLEEWRYPVIKLRHRPSLIPILSAYKYGKEGAETRAANSLPRQGKNNNQLLSIIRFSYYLLDYLIGQWYIKLRYVSQGKLVIYDRYYFDFMADPRRSNLNLPVWLTNLCWKFIHTPNLNILLLADPEVILKRKQELSLETIGFLNKQYGKTFETLASKSPEKYLQINNVNIQSTLTTITHTLKSRLGL